MVIAIKALIAGILVLLAYSAHNLMHKTDMTPDMITQDMIDEFEELDFKLTGGEQLPEQ